ncbi:MAG: ATP-binding protein, partial [bacterium]
MQNELKTKTRKSKILIIDDERHINNALSRFVELQGYDVISAYDGEEGYASVVKHTPDLILLDIVLPKTSGFEVCRMIRGNQALRSIPIIMLTSLSSKEDRIMGIKAGCDEFAQKPISLDELKVRINSLLKINYYRSMVNEKEKFERIVHSVHDGIFLLDASGNLIDANPFGLRLLNASLSELKSAHLAEFLKNNFTFDEELDLFNPQGKDSASVEMYRPETETVKALYIFVRVHYIYDPSGAVSSLIITMQDVTEFHKEEIIKRNFISLISHKLLTPLTVILGNQDMLQSLGMTNLTHDQKRLLQQIFDKSNQMSHLIEKLLLFVEISSDKISDPKETIEISDFIEKKVKRFFAVFIKKSVECNVDIAHKPLYVNMLPRHLEVIIDNLLDNAVKHNIKGSKNIAVHIDLQLSEDTKNLILSVQDNGPGIPQEEYSRIFETFYQVEKYFTGNKEGVGLGLALVKQLIEYYGGSIGVKSHLKKGSIFTVHLPC